MYVVDIAAAAFDVLGDNKMTLSPPALKSVTTVVAALAASVTVPVALIFPSITPRTMEATSLGSSVPSTGSVL